MVISKNIDDPLAARSVYFDGGCPLCSREIALYQRLGAEGGAVSFVNIMGADCALPYGLNEDLALKRLHVTRADGTLVSGAEAFIALWRATPRFKLAGRLASIPPLPWLLERGYRGFLVIRPLWRKQRTI